MNMPTFKVPFPFQKWDQKNPGQKLTTFSVIGSSYLVVSILKWYALALAICIYYRYANALRTDACTAKINKENISKIPKDSVTELHGNQHSRQETSWILFLVFMLALSVAKDMLLSCSCLIWKWAEYHKMQYFLEGLEK